MTIGRQFHGDLEAGAKCDNAGGGTDVKSSAGYVSIERTLASYSSNKCPTLTLSCRAPYVM